MGVNTERFLEIQKSLEEKNVALVAVSKTKPVEDIMELYQWGQRDFGENYVRYTLAFYWTFANQQSEIHCFFCSPDS
jgi:uncharacterized pyridoxal phosphate-containing UPF0001 family protein